MELDTAGIGFDQPGPARDEVDADRDALDLMCFRNLMASTTDIIYFKDMASRYLRISAGTAKSYGESDPVSLEGRSDADFYTPEHAEEMARVELAIAETGRGLVDAEERQQWPDREDTWVSSTKLPLVDAAGQVIGTFGVSRDISRRVQAEQRAQRISEALASSLRDLRKVEADLRRVLEISPDAIVRVDADLRWTYVNAAAAPLLGLPPGTRLGQSSHELGGIAPELVATWVPALEKVARDRCSLEIEFELPGPDGPRWMQTRLVPEVDHDGSVDGRLDGVLTVTRDLTLQKTAERQLEHRARHDPLTGLLNRSMLLQTLQEALGRLATHPSRLAVMFIDLDGFKRVNDTYGHDEGDRVLQEVAGRLRRTCRSHDSIARLGGDEFVVVCEAFGSRDDVEIVAGRIAAAIARPMRGEGGSSGVPASVGVATTLSPHATPEALLAAADAAMYRAKAAGGAGHDLHPHDAGLSAQPVSR